MSADTNKAETGLQWARSVTTQNKALKLYKESNKQAQ